MADNLSNEAFSYLEGIISLTAAISAKNRNIINVYIDKAKHEKRDRKITHLISVLKKEAVPFTLCERDIIDSLCQSSSHGGVIAKVSPYKYTELSELITEIKEQGYGVMLDGVEDPYNFGYAIRNLFAFGCKSFIIPQRNWMSASNVVATSSAGASELCRMSVADSDAALIKVLKENGIEIVCSALSSSSVSLYNFKPERPFVLFIGGEKRGISKDFMENADKVVHIPYANENAKYSLPTASCAAIFGSYLSSL